MSALQRRPKGALACFHCLYLGDFPRPIVALSPYQSFTRNYRFISGSYSEGNPQLQKKGLFARCHGAESDRFLSLIFLCVWYVHLHPTCTAHASSSSRVALKNPCYFRMPQHSFCCALNRTANTTAYALQLDCPPSR